MTDKLITAMTLSKNIHGYIALTSQTAESVAQAHHLNVISECIFSRAMTASVLLSGSLKNVGDKLIVSWTCTGSAQKIVVEVGESGEVRGFIENPQLELIDKSLDGTSILSEPYIGFGDITVTRYSNCYATPYRSMSVIETGEIAEDIATYIDQSLQLRNALNIGFEISPEGKLVVCGGILLMAMPGATDDEINSLFDKFNSIKSFTNLLKDATDDETKFKNDLLNLFDMQEVSTKPIRFSCHCNRDSVRNILKGLKPESLKEYRDESGAIKVDCQYCGKQYVFNDGDL